MVVISDTNAPLLHHHVNPAKIKHIRNMAIKKKEGVPTGTEGNGKGASVKMLKGAIKIDGKVYALKTGVQIRNRRGTVKLMTRVPLANGKVERVGGDEGFVSLLPYTLVDYSLEKVEYVG